MLFNNNKHYIIFFYSKEGHYIKVIGSLRTSQQDNKGVLAFNIRSIENFNEITSHFLEIIKINLEEKKNNVIYIYIYIYIFENI